MMPLRLVGSWLAVTVAALLAGTAEAYEHLGWKMVGSDVRLSQHWRTLPIALTVDNGGDQCPARDRGRRHVERSSRWRRIPGAR